MLSFLNYTKYPNSVFRDRSRMHRFKKMVFTFDRTTDCFYSPERATDGSNRHGRSAHLNQALERKTMGVTEIDLEIMKESFTNFRHIENCPAQRLKKFSTLF